MYPLFDVLWKLGRHDDLLPTLEPMLAFDRPEAVFRLGRMYAEGVGVEQDLEKAKELMLQASKRKAVYRPRYEALIERTEGVVTPRPQEDI